MSKKLIKVISVILAILMVSSTFTFVMAAEEDTAASDVKDVVTDVTGAIDDIVNTDEATWAGIKKLFEDYIKGYNDRHSQPENQWIVDLNGEKIDILSLGGFKDAVLNISSTQELKYVGFELLEWMAAGILGFLADTLPDPDYFMNEKDYKKAHSGFLAMQMQVLYLMTGRQRIIILAVSSTPTTVFQTRLKQLSTI